MPQLDKEITDILGIPRLTLHSWKTGTSHTKLLYGILKNMSVAELREKKDMAEKVFNLLVITRDDLYQRLYHNELIHQPLQGYDNAQLVANIDITSKDDMIILRSSNDEDKPLTAHYILKGSHTKATAKKFIDTVFDVLSRREDIPKNMINLHLYGVDLKPSIYLDLAMSGIIVRTHNLNEVLDIDKELVIMNHI